jgi:origin recognition complex subunit 3
VFQHVETVEEAMVIHLNSTQAPNLKSVLKHINRQAADQSSTDGDGNRYLNYDLQFLCDHIQTTSTKKVVVFFTDSESFNESLLADLIDILR